MGNLLLALVQKRHLQTTPSPISISNTASSPSLSSFPVRFLMRSCGLPSEAAISTSRNLRLREEDSHKYDSVVNFLKSHGFSDAQVGKLVAKRPGILRSHLDVLRPKFDCIIHNGVVGPLLPHVVVNCPRIWDISLASQIKPSFDLLRKYVDTDENVVKAVARWPGVVAYNIKRTEASVDFLLSRMVPKETVSKLILRQPRVLLTSLHRMANVLHTVRELGVQPDAPMFVSVFVVLLSLSDSAFQKKMGFFEGLGWSVEDIWYTLKRSPFCFSCSQDKIKGALEFYVNALKLEPEFIRGSPTLLTYSIDKRVRPRYAVLKLLESKGMIQLTRGRVSWILQSEKSFLEGYVHKYLDRVPDLMEFYNASIMANK